MRQPVCMQATHAAKAALTLLSEARPALTRSSSVPPLAAAPPGGAEEEAEAEAPVLGSADNCLPCASTIALSAACADRIVSNLPVSGRRTKKPPLVRDVAVGMYMTILNGGERCVYREGLMPLLSCLA